MQREELCAAQSSLDVHRAGPGSLCYQRGCDMRAFACYLPPIQSSYDGCIKADSRGVIPASRWRKGGRSSGVTREREQTAASPVSGDVETGKICIWPLIAVSRQVSINQTGIPGIDVFVG